MYNQLKKILDKPSPFAVESRLELWTKPHLADQMLKTHLDPQTDLASRRPEIIQATVDFLMRRMGKVPKTLLDLGCGPGLYTSLLSQNNYDVHGMDFSDKALQYAKQHDKIGHYTLGNYVTDPLPVKADLITLIYCDYCALNPENRRILLKKIVHALKPGGIFAFDVHTPLHFDSLKAETSITHHDQAGFFSPLDHVVIHQRHLYPSNMITLDRFDVFTPLETYSLYNWLQHFSLETLKEELETCGLEILEAYDDFTGKPYTGKNTELMVIARPLQV